MRITLAFLHRTRFSFLVLLSLSAFTLAACDSGGSNGNNGGNGEDGSFPEPPGRPGFVSTVAGDWKASLSGGAVHVHPDHRGADAPAFVIRLSDADADAPVITLTAPTALRPGRYAIRPLGTDGIMARIQNPDTQRRWTGLSGQVQIDRYSETAVVGRFRVVADGERGTSVTTSGAFVTTPAEQQ